MVIVCNMVIVCYIYTYYIYTCIHTASTSTSYQELPARCVSMPEEAKRMIESDELEEDGLLHPGGERRGPFKRFNGDLI